MRSWFPLYAGVASLVLSLACAPAPTALSEAHAAAIRDSVTQAQTRFRELSARAHWDSLGAFYSTAPGFRFAESGAVQYRSATEVRRALSRMPAGTRIETSYRDSEIDAVAPWGRGPHDLVRDQLCRYHRRPVQLRRGSDLALGPRVGRLAHSGRPFLGPGAETWLTDDGPLPAIWLPH